MFWWQVDEGFRSVLDEAGLGQFEVLMDEPVGELLDDSEGSRQLRRISIFSNGQPRQLFLKRIGREPLGTLLRMLVFGRKPRSGPLREKMMIDALASAGLPVMRALAWGEERRFGLPVRGFLLVEGVRGTDLADLFTAGSAVERRSLMHALGKFVGRLHGAGFYQPVRLKDVFCETTHEGNEDSYSFVLIDRESSKPWPSRSSLRRCINSLARAYRRTIRDEYCISRDEIKMFTESYLDVLKPGGVSSARAFRRSVYRVVLRELKGSFGR